MFAKCERWSSYAIDDRKPRSRSCPPGYLIILWMGHSTTVRLLMRKQDKRRRSLRWEEVLILSRERKTQATIRRCYEIWRREMQIPVSCDNSLCIFHSMQLVWNDKPLKLILDHSDGNKFNNVPTNLRYLCPNCDSQLL